MKRSLTPYLFIGFWLSCFVLFVILTGVYYKSSLAETNIGPQVIDAFKNHFL